MMYDEVLSYLESVKDGHTEWAREHAAETLAYLSEVGLKPDSDLAQLYTAFGWGFRTRAPRYELLEPEGIPELTAYAHNELGVPCNFIALTSIEGQGITLLDRESGKVFDVEYGQFELLEQSLLEPFAESFGDFLRWYISDDD